jgi:hypothetical protein
VPIRCFPGFAITPGVNAVARPVQGPAPIAYCHGAQVTDRAYVGIVLVIAAWLILFNITSGDDRMPLIDSGPALLNCSFGVRRPEHRFALGAMPRQRFSPTGRCREEDRTR